MEFFVMARIFRHPDDAISLRDVWTFADGELNVLGEAASRRLDDEKQVAKLHREVASSTQALIEFWDLVNFTRTGKGRVQYRNYLYFEALHALREATVGMLNGLPRASTGLLRSVLEMVLLHCWWQKRIERTGNSKQFYGWLEGRRPQPRFRDIVANNLDWLEFPAATEASKSIQHTYNQLCSYVHAPIREESLTMLNRGNVGRGAAAVLNHWLALAREVLLIGLQQLVHLYPQSIFPVDVYRKFGFNPPVGTYFDKFNFVPLEAVFGIAQIESWRSRLRNHLTVEGLLDFYNSRLDLTEEEILQTWDYVKCSSPVDRETDDPVARWFTVKAQMRAISMGMTYSEPLGPYW